MRFNFIKIYDTVINCQYSTYGQLEWCPDPAVGLCYPSQAIKHNHELPESIFLSWTKCNFLDRLFLHWELPVCTV